MSVSAFTSEIEDLADKGAYSDILSKREAEIQAVWKAQQKVAVCDLFLKDILARDGYARTRIVSGMAALFRRERGRPAGANNFTQ
jgi:hypothetical protein